MSLAIDPETVGAVLIAGQWYDVEDASFDLDAYEYVAHWQNWDQEKTNVLYRYTPGSPISSTGCSFRTEMDGKCVTMIAPLNHVQAVSLSGKYIREKKIAMKAERERAEKGEGG